MTYSLAQIVSLTGIKAHTLRVWDRRYTLLEPIRSETNIRGYTDAHLRLLLNIATLRRQGFKISLIDRMTEIEIHQKVKELLSTGQGENEEVIGLLIISMIDLNEDEFEAIYNREVESKGLVNTMTKLIYPFLHKVGMLWMTNDAFATQEHFVSNLLRRKILVSIDGQSKPREDARTIMLFLPDGEYHEMGLLLSHYIAADLGFKVYYFGQSVPYTDLHEMVKRISPEFLFTIYTLRQNLDVINNLITIAAEHNSRLLIGGPPDILKAIKTEGAYTLVRNPSDFSELLQRELESF